MTETQRLYDMPVLAQLSVLHEACTCKIVFCIISQSMFIVHLFQPLHTDPKFQLLVVVVVISGMTI